MSQAFKEACIPLHVFDGDIRGRLIVATRIIDLASDGIIDAKALAWGPVGTPAPVGWGTWLSRTLPADADAGGGLMVRSFSAGLRWARPWAVPSSMEVDTKLPSASARHC